MDKFKKNAESAKKESIISAKEVVHRYVIEISELNDALARGNTLS